MAAKAKQVLKDKGPTAIGMFGSGQWTIWEGYAATKLMRGGLPLEQSRPQRAPLHGIGRLRLHAHLRHGRADGLLRRFRGRRRLRAVGLEHGGDASDPVDARGRPPAGPSACEGRGAVDLHPPQRGSRRHPDRLQAGHRSRDPQLHRQPHHQDRPGQPGLRRATTRTS